MNEVKKLAKFEIQIVGKTDGRMLILKNTSFQDENDKILRLSLMKMLVSELEVEKAYLMQEILPIDSELKTRLKRDG